MSRAACKSDKLYVCIWDVYPNSELNMWAPVVLKQDHSQAVNMSVDNSWFLRIFFNVGEMNKFQDMTLEIIYNKRENTVNLLNSWY